MSLNQTLDVCYDSLKTAACSCMHRVVFVDEFVGFGLQQLYRMVLTKMYYGCTMDGTRYHSTVSSKSVTTIEIRDIYENIHLY